MKKVRKPYYLAGGIVLGLGFAGLAAYGVAALVTAAQRQANVQFVDVEPYEPERYFSDAPEPTTEIRETFLGNKLGWIVNKGPVRITSDYRDLFDKETLVELANWAYKELPWGANALSMSTINFTTGAGNASSGVIMGSHKGGRDAAAVYVSPDAFETVRNISKTTFESFLAIAQRTSPNRAAYEKALADYMATRPLAGPLVSPDLEADLIKTFQNQPFTMLHPILQELPEYRTYYQALTPAQITAALFNPDDVTQSQLFQLYQGQATFPDWADTAQRLGNVYLGFSDKLEVAGTVNEYLRTKKAEWERVFRGNYLSPLAPGDIIRVLAARAKNRVPELLSATVPRYAFDAALAMVKAATTITYNGANGPFQTYDYMAWLLYELLPEVMFAPDTVLVEPRKQADGTVKDVPNPTYSVRPVDEWDAAWASVKARLAARYENPTLLGQQEGAYQLFKHYYQFAHKAYTGAFAPASGVATTFGDWVSDKIELLKNYYNGRISSASAGERIRFMTAGRMTARDTIWRTREDAALGLISVPEVDAPTTTRQVSMQNDPDVTAFLRTLLEDKTLLPGNDGTSDSLKERFRRDILNAMRYTIAHEYGHHETMWQAYGDYPESHEIYSVERAARESQNINAGIFDRLDAISKATGKFKNAVEIVKRSNDKYSATWTPTYSYYDEHNFVSRVLDDKGQEIISSTWAGRDLQPYYSVRNETTSIPPEDELLNGMMPWEEREVGVDDYSADGDPWQGGDSKYLYVVHPFDARVNGRPSPWAFALFANRISNNTDDWRQKNFRGTPLNLSYSLSELLWYYQLSIWQQEGKDAAWEAEHGFRLPRVGTVQAPLMTQKGTVRYASRLNMYGLETTIYYQFVMDRFKVEKSQVDAIIAALDAVIDRYYDAIIAEYPNFFEDAAGLKALSAYERSLITTAMVIKDTKAALADTGYNDGNYQDILGSKPGVYFNPTLSIYKKYQDLFNEDELWRSFGERDKLVTDGTVEQRFAKTGNTDYTGGYSEFLTRAWNQLTYRPQTANYLVTTASGRRGIDFGKYRTYEAGWLEDTTRFYAQGTPFYNYDLRSPSDTRMTEAGGKLLMWFRELFGVGTSLDLLKPLPRTATNELDFAAMDAALTRPNTVEKVYRNPKTERLTAWGWFTAAEAARYKYIVFRNANGSTNYVPLKANANTSNYFYYTDLTREVRRPMFPGFVQWVSDPFIFGKFANAELKVGTAEIYFSDAEGGELVTLASTTTDAPAWRTNNDHERVIAEVIVTITPPANGQKGRITANTRSL